MPRRKIHAATQIDHGALQRFGKFDQPIEDAYQLDFTFRVSASNADYLQVQLSAGEGPLSTKNYRIIVEAVPIDARKSVIHMSYAYGSGCAAKIAMQTYLATLGSAKVGFTVLEKKPDGKPVSQAGVGYIEGTSRTISAFQR